MSGKCLGNRPPPCGRGKNCKGFENGHRCGAHAPVKGCSRKKAAASSPKTYLGIPVEQLDPGYKAFLELAGEI